MSTLNKQVKPVKVVNYNVNAANCYVLSIMKYVHFLRNINYQSTSICRQIIRVDIEVEYLCDNIIYHCIFLQIQCTKYSMELVWKCGRLSSISFYSGIFHIPYRNFRFIPYHALVVNSILLLLLLHFTPTVLARLKIRKRLTLKKLLPLPAPLQHFRFRFQPLSLKCFRFHKNITASSFHNPELNTNLFKNVKM